MGDPAMTADRRADCERFHRRDFLKVGTAGLLGLGLADLLRLEAGTATKGPPRKKATGAILLWLAGGPSTIDMWDLKPDAPDNIRGEFKPVATSARGVRISEHLPKTAKVMDRAVLVRSLHHSIPEHGVGTQYMMTGNAPSPTRTYPSLGSLAARTLRPAAGVPPYVVFPGAGAGAAANAGFLGPAYNPYAVAGDPLRGTLRVEGVALPDGFTPAELDDRARLRAKFDARFKALDRADLPASLDKFHRQALDILRSDRTRQAFDASKESDRTRERYGRTPFGQSVLVARRLMEAGARFVTVGLGGWDTHANNFTVLRTQLLPPLDAALAALVADLDERGLLATTVVCCAGEFNRTPQINGAAGRDHWARSMAVFLSGGPLRRGHAHGSTDREGLAPADAPCTPDDVAATLFHCLGVEPWHEVQTPSGRPLAIFREGKVIKEVVG
jgi:hypothetical protein